MLAEKFFLVLETLRSIASDGSVKVVSNAPHVPIKALPQNQLKLGVLIMGNIPLDLQRRCERRWAARFSRPVEPVASRRQEPERESQQIGAPGSGKRKTRRVRPAGFRSAPAV
jgi:hypothetical protein